MSLDPFEIFPRGGIATIGGLPTGDRFADDEIGIAINGYGGPELMGDEQELGRWIFGWDEPEEGPARLWADLGPSNGGYQVLAKGRFGVLLTSHALRCTLMQGTVENLGRMDWAGKDGRIYAFSWPLLAVDYVEGDRSVIGVGSNRPEALLETIHAHRANKRWSVAGIGMFNKSRDLLTDLVSAVARAQQAGHSDPAQRARAEEILRGAVAHQVGSREGDTLSFAADRPS